MQTKKEFKQEKWCVASIQMLNTMQKKLMMYWARTIETIFSDNISAIVVVFRALQYYSNTQQDIPMGYKMDILYKKTGIVVVGDHLRNEKKKRKL